MAPSPALGLTADVTKGESGTDVELSWDHTEWYTTNETSDELDSTADTTHSYQYKCPACEDTDWQGASVTYTDEDGTVITTGTVTKGTRAKLDVPGLDSAVGHLHY